MSNCAHQPLPFSGEDAKSLLSNKVGEYMENVNIVIY